MTIATTVISIVLAVPFLGSGAAKLAGATTMRTNAEHFGLTYPAYRLIGVAEVAGAAGLLAGLAVTPLGIAAAAGLFLLMAGAVGFHLRARDTPGEIAPAAGLSVAALILTVLLATSM